MQVFVDDCLCCLLAETIKIDERCVKKQRNGKNRCIFSERIITCEVKLSGQWHELKLLSHIH